MPLDEKYEKRPDHPLPPSYRPPDSLPYRVADGDYWEKVANALRYTNAWDLIEFNFQTRDPREVNYYLRENVGCVLPTDDQKNWRFSTAATPGVIYYARCQVRPVSGLIKGRFCPEVRPKDPDISNRDRGTNYAYNAYYHLKEYETGTQRERILLCMLSKMAFRKDVDDEFLHWSIVRDYVETDRYRDDSVSDVAWSLRGCLGRFGVGKTLEEQIEIAYYYEQIMAKGIAMISNYQAQDTTSKIPHSVDLWRWMLKKVERLAQPLPLLPASHQGSLARECVLNVEAPTVFVADRLFKRLVAAD